MIGNENLWRREAMGNGRRICGRGIALFVLLLGASAGGRAQGTRYDNIALGPRGTPVGAATIAVCAAGAVTTTTPCSPLASIYSDEALTQPLANPFQTDALGNYGFWAVPGHYVVQIYGTGVTTKAMDVFLPCDPTACTVSGTSATFSSITTSTLNLTGTLTVDGRSVATEPLAGDALMYVSPNGSDSNDGLSWGTAKKTLYAAVQTISSQTANSGNQGGTIYVADNVSCGGPISNQGLMIYTAGSSPGNGWLKVPSALSIIGVGTTHWGNNGSSGVVALNCGSSTQPGLELQNVNTALHFANLAFGGSIGADLVSGVTTVSFENVVFTANDSNATNGPAVLVGDASFWLFFNDCVFQANDNTGKATNGSDATEAFVAAVSSGNPNTDLVYITHSVVRNGDIKWDNYTSSSLFVDGLTTENQNDGKGAVWFPVDGSGNASANGFSDFTIFNVGVADATVNPTPAVEVDTSSGNSDAMSVLAANVTGYGLNTEGPMMLLSQYPNNVQDETQIPPQKGQEGIIEGRLWAQDDTARRLFTPVASRFSNLASYCGNNSVCSQGSGSWYTNSGTPNPTFVVAPDGTSDAVQITGGSGGSSLGWSTSQTSNNSDYMIGGLWIRNASGSGGSPPLDINTGCTAVPLPLTPASFGYPTAGLGTQEGVSGEWEWVSYAYKLSGLSGPTACNLGFVIQAGANQTMQFYAPIFYYVPSGTITDAEAAWLAMTLAPYPDSISPPVEATLRGHPFAFGGSGDNHFATLDHTALTANQTYDLPNASGTVALALSGTSGSIGGSALAAGACTTGTVSVSGATTSMAVAASPAADPGTGFTWEGWVSSAGTVTVRVCNVSGASATPTAETYNVRVVQ